MPAEPDIWMVSPQGRKCSSYYYFLQHSVINKMMYIYTAKIIFLSKCCRHAMTFYANAHFPYSRYPANTKHLYNICTTSAQRFRRWSNIVQMLFKCFVFAGWSLEMPSAVLRAVLRVDPSICPCCGRVPPASTVGRRQKIEHEHSFSICPGSNTAESSGVDPSNPYSAELFCSNHGDWRVFVQFKIIINILVSSFRFIWIPMLWVFDHYKFFNFFSAGIVFIRQNLTSTDVRFWRIKTIPALKGLNTWIICETPKLRVISVYTSHCLQGIRVTSLGHRGMNRRINSPVT